ncbi:MAG: PASTA domain-containing protein [Deltaproteobacteria bacterium]|nr:PASTA domain-containing protein [Deltaproteobacteria bacterium]
MTPTIGKWVRLRIVMVAVGLLLVSLWITGRFFQLQILEGRDLYEEATGEYKKFCPILPVRGLILDRRGTELAVSARVSSLVAHPKQIKNAGRLSRELAPVLGMKSLELQEIITRPRPFVWVKRHLTPEREEAFLAWKAEAEKRYKAPKGTDPRRDIDAVYLIPEAKRIYPQRALAGPILGFCDIDGKGLEGLESQFDETLYGQPKQYWKMIDARGHIVSTGEKAWDPEVMGNNLVLTIDRTIQHIAEKELAKGVEKWHAAGGLALVMQPQTGEILAMAQTPAMDPNFYFKYPEDDRRNRNVTHALEPGSTYKIFIAAAALDAQMVKPADKFHCENGKYAVSSKEVIHDCHPYGTLTVQQIIQKSSNIGAYKISTKMRPAVLDEYLKNFGFGLRSGIIFPGESSGVMRALRHARSAIDRATVAFGQGIAVSPLQLLMGLSAMGNDGEVMEPLLVKEIVSPQGQKIKELQPRPLRRVLSPQTARTMLAIMETVTQQGGTATQAAVEGFTVAGKTGTAQKLVGRAYSHSKFNALFIGLVPADKPVLAISVIIDEPRGAIYGGVVSAPIFKEIAAQSLRVLGYYPEKELKKENEAVLAKNQKGKKEQKNEKPAVAAKNGKDKENNESALVLGGIIPFSVAAANAQEVKFTPPKLQVPPGPVTVMPDLRGYTIRQVLDVLNRSGLHCRFEGSGLAVGHDPPPGAAINPGESCVVRFQGSS